MAETPVGTGQANTQPQAPSDVEREEAAQAARIASTRAVATVDPKAKTDANLTKLLSLTGYEQADVNGYNADTRVLVTKNGGKYLLSKSGKAVRRISGPLSPAEQEAAQPGEDEDDTSTSPGT